MCNFYNQKSGQAVEFTYEAYKGKLLKGQGNTSKGCPRDVAHPLIQIQELDLMFIHQFMHGITDFFFPLLGMIWTSNVAKTSSTLFLPDPRPWHFPMTQISLPDLNLLKLCG